MFPEILKRMREYIRNRHYVMTLHAEEEMSDDELTILDVERGILTGGIVERQKDQLTGEWKYYVQGANMVDESIAVVAKFGPTGKLIIITVFRV